MRGGYQWRLAVIILLANTSVQAQQTLPQAPPATMPNSEITAREVLSVLNERTSANDARFNAQEKAVAAALSAAKEAVIKAEVSADKRFELINEFRAQSKDQNVTFATRVETAALIKALDDKVQALDTRLTAWVARGEGASWLGGVIGAVAGVVFGLITAGATIMAMRRRPAV